MYFMNRQDDLAKRLGFAGAGFGVLAKMHALLTPHQKYKNKKCNASNRIDSFSKACANKHCVVKYHNTAALLCFAGLWSNVLAQMHAILS